MNLFKTIGIHQRLLIAAVVLISASTFTLGYFGLGMINRFVALRFEQRIDYMAANLAINAELGILIGEKDLLKGLAISLLNEKDIAAIEIENSVGKILVKEAGNLSAPFETVEKPVVLSETENLNPGLNPGGKFSGERQEIGLVRIQYTREGINELLQAMKLRFVVAALVLAGIFCAIFFFISRSLVSPVISLAGVAKKVSNGDISVRAISGSIPETRKLAHAFNEMLDSIEDGRKALIRAHEKMARQEALAEVGKFSMMIAHEVKNPLAIMKSSLEMLKEDFAIPDDNLFVNYAEEELTRLNDLIESFLIFSRPDKPNFALTDLNALVEQVVAGFEIQYASDERKLITSIPSEPCFAEADSDRFSRALSNVIRNALEAGPDMGKVFISVKISETDWSVFVRDQGPGIDPDTADRIFEPFYTMKAKGTGLGLVFADQVVKAHAGKISAGNSEDGGARFCITIPLSVKAEPKT